MIARGAGPFVLLWISAWREQRRGAKATGRLISVPLGILVPLALLTGLASGPNDSPWAVAFGGLHVAVVHLVTFGDERGLLDGSLVFQGLLWQALFAMLVLAGLWRKRDLWLGRAST